MQRPLLGPVVLAALAPVGTAQVVSFGTGCAGASGEIPQIQVPAWPYTGNTLFLDAVGPPSTQGVLFVGVDNQSWSGVPLPLDLAPLGFPGCALLTRPNLMLPIASDETGVHRTVATGWSAGKTLYLQSFYLDASPSVLGGFSEGVAITAAGLPPVGSFCVTEIMQNPDFVFDQNGEYFEIKNTTEHTINLERWIVSDDTGSHTLDVGGAGILVGSGEYYVLGRKDDPAINGGTPIQYGYGGDLRLHNTSDFVRIQSPDGTTIDVVAYDDGLTFPDPKGASMSLDGALENHVDNDLGAHWCTGQSPIGGPQSNPDLGTPGTPNPTCPGD